MASSFTIAQFKTFAIDALSTYSPSPQLDCEVLLQFILDYSRTQILLNRNEVISEEKLAWLMNAVEKRKTGLPVAYITGHKEFFGYDFNVSPAVLIPKPDTEILVERALDLVIEKMEAHENRLLTICDMCTGSGCIGISVLKALHENYDIPVSQLPMVTLVDISPAALEMAQKNANTLLTQKDMLSRVRFIRSNLFQLVPQSFDLILTNPPYIPHSMVKELLKDGRSEPVLALDGDVTCTGEAALNWDGSLCDDGLEIIRNLIPQMKEHLSPLGMVLMEAGEYNVEAAGIYSKEYGFDYMIHKDLEGQLRLLEMHVVNK